MISNDLVSIIIPVYNAEDYLKEAIVSIQNQTYSNLEIICVDDCSTDDSLKILSELEKDDNRIKIFKNNSNQGIVYALNKAIANSTGEIIARMDADDVSLPERIECQVDFLLNNGLDFVGSPVKYITEDGREMGCSSFYTPEQIVKYLKYKSTLGHPTWLLYRHIYEDLEGYRDLAPAEDYDCLLRAVKKGVKVGMTTKPLLKFRTQSKKGGTALTNGLVQRRMFNYVRRLEKGVLPYSNEEIERVKSVNKVYKKLFYFSQIFYYRATSQKHGKNYFSSALYLCFSVLMSPYQMQFVYRSCVLKFLMLMRKK